ncbi:MAG: amidohydrolase family protein, partial [ANME-2 cluster archaeon]|nr:amidohydrolase family protein [ANME-2 cluster archaeon]
MSDEHVISGTILYGDEPMLIEGYLCVKDGMITEVGTDPSVDATLDGLVTPCFVNAHTHAGDSIIKDPPLSDLDSLVRPPDGLKHRVLGESLAIDLTDAMNRTLNDMIRTGTRAFCDFREGGIAGASMLADILATPPYSSAGLEGVIMGRPHQPDRPGKDELDDLVEVCNGIGMSGVNDVPFEVLQVASNVAHRAGKLFAIHGGEKDMSDISRSIEL